jgi:hypothetical protein
MCCKEHQQGIHPRRDALCRAVVEAATFKVLVYELFLEKMARALVTDVQNQCASGMLKLVTEVGFAFVFGLLACR